MTGNGFARWVGLGSILLASLLFGEVRRMPQDYPTIQSALDAVMNEDTVLVSLGTYAEELSAPPLRFWLIGDVEVDTGDFARPLIDPSTLDNPLYRKCMTLPDGGQVTIERMAFHNGAAMYPVREYSTGGVYVHSTQPAVFRYCSFDSVRWAITSIADSVIPPVRVHFTIEDTRFTNAPRAQVVAIACGCLGLRRSYFHGLRGAFFSANDSARVEHCVFTGDSIGGGIVIWGTNPIIRDCIFGPIDTCRSRLLKLVGVTDPVVENNLFQNIRVISGWQFALFSVGWGEPMQFRDNEFVNVRTSITCFDATFAYEGQEGTVADIDSNLFQNMIEDCTWAAAKVLGFGHTTHLVGNRFINVLPQSVACIASYRPADEPLSVLRYNQFEAGDYAIYSPYRYTDAIYNYWGDPSGPYSALFNPAGLGARVDDSVLFTPWCPDTNCFLSVPGLGQPLPEQFVFEAYPNPFNNVVHLTLIPSKIGIVKVELFDLLGRRVQEIWHGPLAFQKEITFDASALSSGIYFARVTDTINRRPLATTKLVLLK